MRRSTQRDAMKKHADYSFVVGFAAVFIGTFMIAMRFFPNSTPVRIVEMPIHAVEQFFLPDPEQLFGRNHLRVLIVGLDYDYNKLDVESSKQSRSDVIMAVNLDFKNSHIFALSVPRDMAASMPDGRRTKINQAQAEGGINESKAVIARWLGVPSFDRYVMLRINTSKDLIDAIGGIEVNVKNSDALRGIGHNGPITYDDNWGHLHIHLRPGLQHLDGEHAVGYARFRHDWCGDPCRIMRQQQVLHAMVDKIANNRFNTVTHVRQILDVVRKDVDTDFSFREELSSLMAFAHIEQSDVRTAQVPYVDSVNLPGYGDAIIPDNKMKRKLVDEMLFASEERISGPGPATANVPNGIRVRIENGTEDSQLAGRVAAILRRQGFTVTAIAAADTPDVILSLIESLPEDSGKLARVYRALAETLPKARTWNQSDSTDLASDVTVILGHDATNIVP
jgi:LCP family protein required for cell wall assembly